MPTVVNVHEAETRLSKLLRRVEAGEDVLLGRAGEPVARLTRVTIADDLDGAADLFEEA